MFGWKKKKQFAPAITPADPEWNYDSPLESDVQRRVFMVKCEMEHPDIHDGEHPIEIVIENNVVKAIDPYPCDLVSADAAWRLGANTCAVEVERLRYLSAGKAAFDARNNEIPRDVFTKATAIRLSRASLKNYWLHRYFVMNDIPLLTKFLEQKAGYPIEIVTARSITEIFLYPPGPVRSLYQLASTVTTVTYYDDLTRRDLHIGRLQSHARRRNGIWSLASGPGDARILSILEKLWPARVADKNLIWDRLPIVKGSP